MKCAMQGGHDKIVVFSDCKNAIQRLLGEVFDNDIYIDLISQCRELYPYFQKVNFNHISRQLNKTTDCMVKKARTLKDEVSV